MTDLAPRHWGNFTALPEDRSIFDLPKADCAKSCSAVLSGSEIGSLAEHFHVRRAFAHHTSKTQTSTIV